MTDPPRFSAGKPTALVIDIGHSTTSVTPIHDGLQLRKGILHSSLGASFIQQQARHVIASKPAPTVDLVPFHAIASKSYSEHPNPPQYSLRPTKDPPPRESFTSLQENRLLSAFTESVAQVWPGPSPLSAANNLNPPGHGSDVAGILKATTVKQYEFPTGLAVSFTGQERASIPELLFDPKAPTAFPPTGTALTIPEMIKQSVESCDVDIRPTLIANIVVVGGGSLLFGMTERIQNEVSQIWSGTKVRVYASGITVERKYANWIGGSVLASLGTFHQVSPRHSHPVYLISVSQRQLEMEYLILMRRRCGSPARSMRSMVRALWRKGVSDWFLRKERGNSIDEISTRKVNCTDDRTQQIYVMPLYSGNVFPLCP